MSALEKVSTGIRKSRRNVIKVGVKVGVAGAFAIFGSLTRTRRAAADDDGGGDDGRRCFLKGTTIRTADGDRKIEDLAVGDLLPTVFGRMCPIQSIECSLVKNRVLPG